MKRIILGRSGIEVPQLAFGTGTGGWLGKSNQTRKLGKKGLPDLLVYGYEKGISWIDTADQYGSHFHVAEALRRIGRDKVVVTTKTVAQTASWIKKDLDRFRKELNTDYLDIVLLHCQMHPWWTKLLRPCMDVLSEAKAKGIVRAVGVSNHNFGALKATVEEPWVDVCLVRLNPLGNHMEARPDQVIPLIRKMVDDGKGVYGMKVMSVGELGGRTREAFKYQLDNGVPAFTVGMMSQAEVDENVRTLEELAAVTV